MPSHIVKVMRDLWNSRKAEPVEEVSAESLYEAWRRRADQIERGLDEVGREKAFARARAAGWGGYSDVPMFVWWNIIGEMKAEQAKKRKEAPE